jgi:methylglyoxal synthase
LEVKSKVASGPLGGDQEIGGAGARGEVAAIFFFRDPLSSHPHEADIQALARLTDMHDVAIATNRQTATALVYALFHHAELEAELRPYHQQARGDTNRVSKYKNGQSAVIKSVVHDAK